MQFRKWVCSAGTLIFTANALVAQAVLEPPYGLHWGDSPEKLIAWASRQSLNVTITLPASQPKLRILRIQPEKGFLSETQASALEGRFIRGKLFELTVHYFDASATADEMGARFESLRKQTTSDHGPLLPNQQQRVVANQYVTRTLSFHREALKGLFVLLTLTEEEDLLRNSKDTRFSLIYHNDNCMKEWLNP